MTNASPLSKSRLQWLALGIFAIGTEGFMVDPLLPDLACWRRTSSRSAGSVQSAYRRPLRSRR
jgi:predicted MFS family arabinose efflux permease